MAAPKLSTSELRKLFQEGEEKRNEEDKKAIENLRKRLSEKLLNDPLACKKAASILELWIRGGSGRK